MKRKRSPQCSRDQPRKRPTNLQCLLHRPWLLIPRTVPRPPAVIQRTLTAAVSRPTSLSAPSEDISSLLDIWSEDMSLLERVKCVSVWGSGIAGSICPGWTQNWAHPQETARQHTLTSQGNWFLQKIISPWWRGAPIFLIKRFFDNFNFK